MAKVFIEMNKRSGYKHFPEEMKPESDGRLYFVIEKAMYGLFESGRLWYSHVTKFLMTECEMEQTETDPCVFFRRSQEGNVMAVAVLYVDDIAVSTGEIEYWNFFVDELNKQYSTGKNTRNNGADITYLGMEIHQDQREAIIHITQEKYLEKILKTWEAESEAKYESVLQERKPRLRNHTLPHDSNLFDLGEEKEVITQAEVKAQFKSDVMKVAYLAQRTRPDILLVCNFLASQMERTTTKSIRDLYRIVMYLK